MEAKRLAIGGKIITFNDLDAKSLAQFKQQLRQNGITVADETAERLYKNLRGEMTEAQAAAKAEADAKVAEMKAKAEAHAAAIKQSVKPLAKGK